MSFNIKIIRGASEIGGTCLMVSTDTTELITDMGEPLLNIHREVLNHSKISDNTKKYRAVLLSHSHRDHYGQLLGIFPNIAIYMSRGSEILINISNLFLKGTKIELLNVKYFYDRKKFTIGDIEITPYRIDHSCKDSYSLLFESQGKKILFTGDFRASGVECHLFNKLLQDIPKNVDIVLMEGTRIDRPNEEYPTELAVERKLVKIFKNQGNISFLCIASQNLDRILGAYRACLRSKKLLICDPYSAYALEQMRIIDSTLPQYDSRFVKIYFVPSHTKILLDNGYQETIYRYRKSKITIDEISKNKKDCVMLIKDNGGTGKIFDRLGDLSGSTLIYGLWIGYLKDSNLHEICNSRGIDFKHVHSSGHCGVKELLELVKACNPKRVVPIHTTDCNQYKKYFKSTFVLNDGETLKL